MALFFMFLQKSYITDGLSPCCPSQVHSPQERQRMFFLKRQSEHDIVFAGWSLTPCHHILAHILALIHPYLSLQFISQGSCIPPQFKFKPNQTICMFPKLVMVTSTCLHTCCLNHWKQTVSSSCYSSFAEIESLLSKIQLTIDSSVNAGIFVSVINMAPIHKWVRNSGS